MDKLFIDTDVLLDFMIGRHPFAKDAAQILSLAERKKVSICTTALVFSNAYYVLRKLGTHKRVMEKMAKLAELLDIIGIARPAVVRSMSSNFGDFEDALQHFAALSANVRIIITRNTKDYKASELAVLTPDQFLKSRA